MRAQNVCGRCGWQEEDHAARPTAPVLSPASCDTFIASQELGLANESPCRRCGVPFINHRIGGRSPAENVPAESELGAILRRSFQDEYGSDFFNWSQANYERSAVRELAERITLDCIGVLSQFLPREFEVRLRDGSFREYLLDRIEHILLRFDEYNRDRAREMERLYRVQRQRDAEMIEQLMNVGPIRLDRLAEQQAETKKPGPERVIILREPAEGSPHGGA